MTSLRPQQRVLIQDENLNISHKKPMVEEKGKSKTSMIKKGQQGIGVRKALGDITNKPTVRHELSTRTKNKPKEEFNIAEEKFLHDHNKCIEAQKGAVVPCFLDTVLPGHDSMSFGSRESYPEKADADKSNYCYSEPIELPMSEFVDWLKASSQRGSPRHWDSPPSSPFAWEYEPVDFTLRQENDS